MRPRTSTRSLARPPSWAAQGFTAVKQRLPYGPLEGEGGIAKNVELVRTVVDAVGPDVDVMADAYMSWDVGYAIRCIRAIERRRDPAALDRGADDPRRHPRAWRGSGLPCRRPIAAGEHEATRFGFRDLRHGRSGRRPSAGRQPSRRDHRGAAGLGARRDIRARRRAPPRLRAQRSSRRHEPRDAAARVPSASVVAPTRADEDQIFWVAFPDEPRADDGRITLSDRPGLGVSLDSVRPGAGAGMREETLTTAVDLDCLSAIEQRVLWLAVRIVDYANHERPKGDALKVGGHQASSASMVTLMTALYLAELRAEDRVSVKPHASPVLHAIEYLLGRLDGSYLTRLRDFGGPAVVPVPYEGPLSGRLLDRIGGARLGRAALRRARRPVHGDAPRRFDRRSVHLAARGRGARRGKHLGGGRRAADAASRQRPLDRRPEPAVARPRHPRDPRGRAGGALSNERLGGDRAEVRTAAARGAGRGGRRDPAPSDRRDAERAIPVALRRQRGGRPRRPSSTA